MKELELLAPAKNVESGIAAINCGADAVYIGAPKFGARAAASNSFTEIEKLVQYGHKYSAKTYLALNTLLFDNELEEAEEIIHTAWNMGIDAIIFQDMGLLEMNLPPIPLFASTQTHNHNWQKVKFLEDIGISRVILARELSLNQIQQIRSHTSVELEAFVHGAICVCYSGQCYLSHALKGYSGNRGECMQPCRWEYNLIDGSGNVSEKPSHFLSPKDLNLSDHLQNMIDAGITSFKIEGRLKDITYVKNITSFYRKKLDGIITGNANLKKSSSGISNVNFEPDPDKTFNRGFTDYFINGRQSSLASFVSPKSTGKLVGMVLQKDKTSLKIKSFEPIHNGDGLCFIDSKGELKGFRVNKVDNSTIFPFEMPEIERGAELYRNHDQHFETTVLGDHSVRRINIDLTFTETENGFSLLVKDSDENIAESQILHKKELAQNPEKAEASIKQNLSKTGESIFTAQRVDLQLSQSFFLPNSVINEIRRDVLKKLERERLEKYCRNSKPFEANNIPYIDSTLDYRGNIVNHKAKAFYERHGVKEIEQGFELQKSIKGKTLMTTRYCLKFEMGICPKHQSAKDSDEPAYLETRDHVRLKLDFDCCLCQMNISIEN